MLCIGDAWGRVLFPRGVNILEKSFRVLFSAGYSTLADEAKRCPVDRMTEVVIGRELHHRTTEGLRSADTRVFLQVCKHPRRQTLRGPGRYRPWRYDCQWESSRQTRPKPQPQEPCPLSQGCRSCHCFNLVIETGARVPGPWPVMHCRLVPFARTTVLNPSLCNPGRLEQLGIPGNFQLNQHPVQRDATKRPSNEKSANKCGNFIGIG